MGHGDRRKCKCCLKLFRPDPRNRRHQFYCSASGCRAASKAASQARWRAKAENQSYFRGPVNVARVQAWRARHPGYWRKGGGASAALCARHQHDLRRAGYHAPRPHAGPGTTEDGCGIYPGHEPGRARSRSARPGRGRSEPAQAARPDAFRAVRLLIRSRRDGRPNAHRLLSAMHRNDCPRWAGICKILSKRRVSTRRLRGRGYLRPPATHS
jgi:hypothetical protein